MRFPLATFEVNWLGHAAFLDVLTRKQCDHQPLVRQWQQCALITACHVGARTWADLYVPALHGAVAYPARRGLESFSPSFLRRRLACSGTTHLPHFLALSHRLALIVRTCILCVAGVWTAVSWQGCRTRRHAYCKRRPPLPSWSWPLSHGRMPTEHSVACCKSSHLLTCLGLLPPLCAVAWFVFDAAIVVVLAHPAKHHEPFIF